MSAHRYDGNDPRPPPENTGHGRSPVAREAIDAVPGVARLAVRAGMRGAVWSVGSGVRSARHLARTVTDPGAVEDLLRGMATDVAEASRTVSSVAAAVARGVPLSEALAHAGMTLSEFSDASAAVEVVEGSARSSAEQEPSLRAQGEALLRRSRDVWSEDEQHPAYARIIGDLAPDEARILLHLFQGGPQPSVDVRTGGPVGVVSSSLVAGGLNMIGARAGVRHVDEVPAYLNNLFRLGLVWFSREALEDPSEYQVVEAQPDVLEAMHSVRFSRVVRRSIHLTPFGIDFCRICLVDEEPTEPPSHLSPDD